MFLDDGQHRFESDGILRMTIQSRAFLALILLSPMGPVIAQNIQGKREAVSSYGVPISRGNFVSLRDFGATGNGSTDDTAAVQAAVSAQPYQKIICPAGTYKMTSTVRFAAGVLILGVGPGSCILKWGSNGMDGIAPASDMVIDNVTLQGGWTSQSTIGCGAGGGCAINGGVGINNVTIRYSTVTGWAGHGINTGGGCGYVVTGNTIQNTRDDGILLVGLCGANQTASDGNGSTVTGNLFSNIGANSVDMNSSNNEIGWNRITRSGFRETGTDFYAILCSAGTNGGLGVINCDENNIHDNTIIGTRGPAIDIRADTGTANRNLVAHNIGQGAGSDMPAITTLVQVDSSVGAGCSGTVDSTLVIGNTANGFANGLVQGGGTFCTITNTLFANNTVTNSTHYGIIVAYGTAVTMGNTISGSGTADLY